MHIRLKEMINKAAEEHDKITPWMMDDICARLKYKREINEGFKIRFERNWKNSENALRLKLDIKGLCQLQCWSSNW